MLGDKESDPSLTIGPQRREQTPKQLIKTKALISIAGRVPSAVGKTETETIDCPGKGGERFTKEETLEIFPEKGGNGGRERRRTESFSKNKDRLRKGHPF